MTKVLVNSGICGFDVTVVAEKDEDKKIRISLDTECQMVKKMLDDIPTLDMRAAFTGFLNNPVYKSAAMHIRHVGCPVPSAIIKAIEVEIEVCLPKDVSMTFIKDKALRGDTGG